MNVKKGDMFYINPFDGGSGKGRAAIVCFPGIFYRSDGKKTSLQILLGLCMIPELFQQNRADRE